MFRIILTTVYICSPILQIILSIVAPGIDDTVFGVSSWNVILLLIPIALISNIIALFYKKLRLLAIVYIFINVLINIFWLLCIGGVGV